MRLALDIGQDTHPGRVRETNEDSLCVLQPPALTNEFDALIVVADGMGGHKAGEVASQYVTDKFQELFASTAYRDWVSFDQAREDYNVLVLKEVIERLNNELYQQSTRREEYRGMGTTATVALIAGQKLFLGHAGDSRAYLLSNGDLHQLTTDHSWVMEQVEQRLMTPEQAAADPRKNQITRALGVGSMLKVERKIVDLLPGDVLLLCTDGLTNMLSDSELRHYLQTIPDAKGVCQALIEAANQRGGGDNITVVVARAANGVVAPPIVANAEAEQKTDRIIVGAKTKDAGPKPRIGRINVHPPAPHVPQLAPAESPMQPVSARMPDVPTPSVPTVKLVETGGAIPEEKAKSQTQSRFGGIALLVTATVLVVFAGLVNLGIVYVYIGQVPNMRDDWFLGPIVGVVTTVFVVVAVLLTAAWFLRTDKTKQIQ